MSKDIRVHGDFVFFDNILWFDYGHSIEKEGILIESTLYLYPEDYMHYVNETFHNEFRQWIQTISTNVKEMPPHIMYIMLSFPSYKELTTKSKKTSGI